MRKVLVPIYLKLVIFVLIIVGSSLSAYVYYSVNLFQNDKISYVYEAVDDHNLKIVERAELKTRDIFNNLNYLPLVSNSSEYVHSLLRSNTEFVSYFEGNASKITKIISFNEDKIIDSDFSLSLIGEDKSGIKFYNLHYIFYTKSENKIFGVITKSNFLEGQTSTDLFNDVYITSEKDLSELDSNLVANIKTQGRVGQTFLIEGDNPYIVSYRLINKDLGLLSKANFNKAIEASLRLRKNSLYFGLLIAGLVIIGVLLFSKIFTRPITKLLSTVKNFLSSDFKDRAKISTRDEIGVLALSFNTMADDILNYMSEMKDKIRLQEELKTANIVQSQFFPKTHYPLPIGNIHGYYRSASECGGDWWGVHQSNNSTVLILADVTGHGTPAALLTAILYNTINAIDYLSKSDSKFLTSSHEIMGYMNNSIAKASKTLNATAFVVCIDHNTKKINYSNASHNPPLYFPIHQGPVDKSKLIPMMENNGPRLGENANQVYASTSVQLNTLDKIIFYTDGLTEAEDENHKAYGQRKLIKSLISKQANSVEVIIDEVLKEFDDYMGDAIPSDDITFVGLEII